MEDLICVNTNEVYYHNPTSYDKIEKFLNVYSPIETIIMHNLNDDLILRLLIIYNAQKYYVIDLNNNVNELSQANNCESHLSDRNHQKIFSRDGLRGIQITYRRQANTPTVSVFY